jgi:CheY-like chemotaxis protein
LWAIRRCLIFHALPKAQNWKRRVSEKKTCLLVEDESLIAMFIEEALLDMGLAVMGPVSRVGRALDLLQATLPSCAVLDINIAGESIHPVAEFLAARGIPFLFVSGYGEAGLSAHLPNRPVLEKPFLIEQLQRAVARLLGDERDRAGLRHET